MPPGVSCAVQTPESDDPITRAPDISPEERALAALAHQVWVDQMMEKGWRHGAVYDAEAKTHDALVPFERLDATDQWTAFVAIHCSGMARTLREAVEYPRGPERILRPEDLREGLAVRIVGHPSELTGGPADVGRVSGWTVDPSTGCVSIVMVRWADGEETRHFPVERDLRPVE